MATKTRPQDPMVDDTHRNPDPITKAPGSHPVGTGVGAAAGGAAAAAGTIAAGAAMGSAVGPVGTAIGAAVGAVAGGLIGKGVAESVNPTMEEAYWRENYQSRPYVSPGTDYDFYAPAYRSGWEARSRYPGRSFDDVEADVQREWENYRGSSTLDWERAKAASRDAWEHVDSGLSD